LKIIRTKAVLIAAKSSLISGPSNYHLIAISSTSATRECKSLTKLMPSHNFMMIMMMGLQPRDTFDPHPTWPHCRALIAFRVIQRIYSRRTAFNIRHNLLRIKTSDDDLLLSLLAMSCDLLPYRKNIFKATYLYFNEPGIGSGDKKSELNHVTMLVGRANYIQHCACITVLNMCIEPPTYAPTK